MFNNTECLFLLIIGNQKNSNAQKIFSKKFKNILRCNNLQEAKALLNNNQIDIILCEDSSSFDAFEFFEEIKENYENILKYVSTKNLNTKNLLKSIELKLDAYLLENSTNEDIESKLNTSLSKYIKNHKISGQYLDIINENISISKTDLEGYITYVNDKFCEISKYSKEELLGKNHNIVRDPQVSKEVFEDLWNTIKNKKQIWKGIVSSKKKDGSSFFCKTTIMPILDKNGKVLEYIAFRVNVAEVINDKDLLKAEIKKDKLSILALFSIVEFKVLENFYSLELVEKIQRIFANSLLNSFENKKLFKKVYFLEKGNFALLCSFENFMESQNRLDVYFEDFVETINNNILTVDNLEYDLNIVLSYSFGKHMLYEDAKEGLDQALNNNIKVFNSNDESLKGQRLNKNLEIIKMVKTALDNYNIIPYFQPIINNKTKNIDKYESLVRLIDSNNNVLSPAEFLDVSKSSHYYSKITHRVLESSFNVIDKINANISINLSFIDIEKDNTRKLIYELLQKHKKHTHKIIFELLEDEESKDFNIIKEFIIRVKSFGIKIALDDFGSGYSSFERIMKYEPDIIKIDGSLIKNIKNCSSSKNLVETIVIFCKKQNITTIAEYVENEEVFDILCELGVDYSQGFYFGKPEDLSLSLS